MARCIFFVENTFCHLTASFPISFFNKQMLEIKNERSEFLMKAYQPKVDILHTKIMSKRLTIDQLMALERLAGREYTVAGTPRKNSRSKYDSHLLGITKEHHIYMKKLNLSKFDSTPALKKFFEKISFSWPDWPE